MPNLSFDLVGMMTTVFDPKPNEHVGVFIDLDNPQELPKLNFREDTELTTRRIAYEVFYRGLIEKKSDLPFASVGSRPE